MAIQTTTVSTGDYGYLSWSNGYKISLTLTQESTNPQSNTSLISYRFTISNTDNNRFISNDYTWNVTLGNQTIGIQNFDFYVYPYNVTQVIAQGQVEVSHDNNGKKTLSYGFSIPNVKAYNQYGPPSMELAGNWELTAIDRASTLGATDAYIGGVSTIAVSRKNSGYSHSIAYRFGNLSGYITEDGAISSQEVCYTQTGIAFTLPETFYGEIPNQSSGICTLTCKTYSGQTQIGGAEQATFTVSAKEELCKPEMQVTVMDVNPDTLSLTGDAQQFIRYHSSVGCEVQTQGQKGATVQEVTVSGVPISGTEHIVEKIENNVLTFRCKDSRGYVSQEDVQLNLIPYVRLTCNVVGGRIDASGNAPLSLKGSFYTGNFGEAENLLSVTYRLDGGEEIPLTVPLGENSYQMDTVLSGLDYETSYILTVTVSDSLETVTKEVVIYPGGPVFDWGKTDFQFHVPVGVDGDLSVGGNITSSCVNGCYMDSIRISGTDYFTIQSCFSDFAGGTNRQSIFLFGGANYGTLIYGVLQIGQGGQIYFSGNASLTITADTQTGRVTVKLPNRAWDYFTLISSQPFARRE